LWGIIDDDIFCFLLKTKMKLLKIFLTYIHESIGAAIECWWIDRAIEKWNKQHLVKIYPPIDVTSIDGPDVPYYRLDRQTSSNSPAK